MRFEDQVTEIYTQRGHLVQQELKRDDSTTDLIIKSAKGEKWIARCISKSQVSANDVNDVLRLAQAEQARQVAIVTTGSFTPNAHELAKGKSLFLIDNPKFQQYWQQAQVQQQTKTAPPDLSTPTRPSIETPQVKTVTSSEMAVPSSLRPCPYCAEMIQANAVICRYCGRELTVKRNRKAKILIPAFIGLVLVIIVTAVVALVRVPLTSVAPVSTMTPEKQYAQDIAPALKELALWSNGPVIDLASAIQNDGQLALLLQVGNRNLFLSQTVDGFVVKIGPIVEELKEEGFKVKSLFGAASPPSAIAVAHNQIVTCIDAKIQVADAIMAFLKNGTVENLSSSDPCGFLDSSVSQIKSYIQK
jgi:hypothetical protein